MTVIAWDGVTLAADRQSSIASTPFCVTKIFRVSKGNRTVLYGAAGNSCDAQEFHQWVIGNRDEPKLTNLHILCIDENGHVFWTDECMNWCKFEDGIMAIGSGGKFALGAMKAGASAYEAVKIACELDIDCGLGIDTLTLET
jgi:20S proteasome alpha/beta subunit